MEFSKEMLRSALTVPIDIGCIRQRGSTLGAMVSDDGGEYARLRDFLRTEAATAGVEIDAKWITNSVSTLLKMFYEGYQEWKAQKSGAIGFGHEFSFPSGRTVIMAEQALLNRLGV